MEFIKTLLHGKVLDTCPICLENVREKHTHTLRCKHQLHKHCYRNLIENNIHRCPSCRADFNQRITHTCQFCNKSIEIHESESGILSNKDGNNLTRNITLLTLGLSAVLIHNFSLFMKGAYAPVIFEMASLKNADVKSSILKEVLLDYEQRIEGAMSQTQVDVLNGIRTLQREMISENLLIKRSGIKGNMLDAEVDRFRSALKAKYPELYGAMKNGNILISRKFGPEGESVRHYKVDYYTDMATRATLLNVDRNSNEIMARVNGERVVEYYLSDPRSVIKERELCQEVLHNLIEGVSVLALDERLRDGGVQYSWS